MDYGGCKMQSIFGGSVVRWFGGSEDSIKNNSIFLSEKRHNFLWKIVEAGGIL